MSLFRVGCAVFLMHAGVFACFHGHREPMPSLGPTLLIVNESSLLYRVTVTPTQVVLVHPNQTTCLQVGMLHGAQTIEFFALASAVRYHTPPQNLMAESGWIVEIGQLPQYDVLSLRPWDPCKPSTSAEVPQDRADSALRL